MTLTGLNPGTLTQIAPHLKDLSHHHPHQRRNGLQYQETKRFPGMQTIHFAISSVAKPDFVQKAAKYLMTKIYRLMIFRR
jgi:hypothetical protein